MNTPPEPIGLVWGVENIGRAIGLTPRQTEHEIRQNRLPVAWQGRRIFAFSTELKAHFEKLRREASQAPFAKPKPEPEPEPEPDDQLARRRYLELSRAHRATIPGPRAPGRGWKVERRSPTPDTSISAAAEAREKKITAEYRAARECLDRVDGKCRSIVGAVLEGAISDERSLKPADLAIFKRGLAALTRHFAGEGDHAP